MPILQLRENIIDKLLMLWSICLIDHYNIIDRKLTKNNIIADFDEYIWEVWNAACKLAASKKLIDNNMQLTKQGLVACYYWQEISQKLLSCP